jgi:small neutral amino acid transporter SnatA (MarC family)
VNGSFSGRLFALPGERVTLAFVRLMGLVLAAIAVELMPRGIRTFMETP